MNDSEKLIVMNVVDTDSKIVMSTKFDDGFHSELCTMCRCTKIYKSISQFSTHKSGRDNKKKFENKTKYISAFDVSLKSVVCFAFYRIHLDSITFAYLLSFDNFS